MIRKIAACLLAAVLTIALFGCGEAPPDKSGDEATKSPDYSHLVLTKEQMLEDYDSIWIAFEENSPFLGIIERAHGPGHIESVAEKHRRRIEEMNLEGDEAMLEFILILFDSVYEACDVDRHANVLNANRYWDVLSGYKEYLDTTPDLQHWVDLMDTPQMAEWYDYYQYLFAGMAQEAESETEAVDYEAQWAEELGRLEQENLTMDILEEGKVAYIKVDSFDTAFMEGNLPRIRAFLEDISDYDHLIIDIQDNGGGNSEYWEAAFVRPNLSEPATTSFVRLMRDSSLAAKFYGYQYEGTTLTVEDVRNNPAFTALNRRDMDALAYAREYHDTIEPEFDTKLFDGEIWVLIGPNVYSASEGFAVFCKATGFATLVGQTTGGGNTGGPIMVELPNSHQLVTFDVEYALNPDGSCSQEQGTPPDIESNTPLQTVLERIGASV